MRIMPGVTILVICFVVFYLITSGTIQSLTMLHIGR